MGMTNELFGGMHYAQFEHVLAPPSHKYDNRDAMLLSLGGVATMGNERAKPLPADSPAPSNEVTERYGAAYFALAGD